MCRAHPCSFLPGFARRWRNRVSCRAALLISNALTSGLFTDDESCSRSSMSAQLRDSNRRRSQPNRASADWTSS
jgi:hypothetical protein